MAYGFLSPCQNPEKNIEGWKDGQNLFYKTLPGTTGDLNNVFKAYAQAEKCP